MQSICDNISVDTDLPFVMTKIEQVQSVSKPDKPIDVEPGLGFVQNAGEDHLQNNTRNRNSKESPIGEKQKIVTGQIPQISSQTSLPQKNQVHVIQENDVLGKLAAALETIKLQNEIIEKLKQESGIASDIHVQTEEVVEETDLKAVAKTGTDECQIIDTIPLIEQKGTMAPWDHSRIRSNMELLIEELDPDVLKTPLYSKYVLDIDDVEEIDVLPTRRKKNEKMLYMLMRRGNKAYKIFLKILETYGYRHVIKQLEPESEEYKGTIKYPGHELVEIMDYTSPKHKEFIEMIECDIELQYPESTEIVVVKKLKKGCVEVTFHLISVGKKSEHELRQILETAVNSGKIGDNKVSPEGFSFEKLTEDEEIPLPGSSIIDHENEIKSLKLQIKELQIENCALKATSVHSHEMEKYKEHEAKKYSDILKEKEQIISSLQEQLDQKKTDKEQLDQWKTDEKQLDQQKTDGKQLDQQKTDKEQLDQQKTDDKDTLEKEAGTDECQIIDSSPLILQKETMARIKSNWKLLIQELVPDDLIRSLFCERVLGIDDVEQLNALSTRRKKTEKMLSMLMKREHKSYRTFLNVLKTHGYEYVVQRLEPEIGSIKKSAEKQESLPILTRIPDLTVEENRCTVTIILHIKDLKLKLFKKVPENAAVEYSFSESGFEVTCDVQNKDKTVTKYKKVIQKLPGPIDPEKCYVKFANEQIILILQKAKECSWEVEIFENMLEQDIGMD